MSKKFGFLLGMLCAGFTAAVGIYYNNQESKVFYDKDSIILPLFIGILVPTFVVVFSILLCESRIVRSIRNGKR